MTPLIAVFAAGVLVSGVAFVALSVMRRATFATQALVLQALTAVLLLASLGAFLPRVSAAPIVSLGPVVSRAPSATAPIAFALAGLTAIWIAGTVLTLVRTAVGMVRLAGIRRRARPGCHDAVLVSAEVDLPFVHGWRSPAIIVPTSSESWSVGMWQAVLAHERAHITRGDVAMRLLRQLTLSLHWLNPAVQWLIARTDHACEGACDDIVLLDGTGARGYVDTLLSFTHVRWAFAPAVSTIVGRGWLEARVADIVDRGRSRRRATRGDRTTPRLLGLAGGVALSLIMPHPVLRLPPVAQVPAAQPQARLDDTTAAIVGLTSLLTDPNPVVRQTARDALLAWEHAGARVFQRRKERLK
jgi:beta-lactamase regulating signal transducer with metallopeptidase domain